jgi:hypothetical protein
VQPTVESNTKRTQVIAYVQKLIDSSIGAEVSSLISDFALKIFNLCWFYLEVDMVSILFGLHVRGGLFKVGLTANSIWRRRILVIF